MQIHTVRRLIWLIVSKMQQTVGCFYTIVEHRYIWFVFSYIMLQIVLHRMFKLRRASRNIRGIDRLCVRCTRRCAIDAMCTYTNGHITPFQEYRAIALCFRNIVTITRVAEMAPNTTWDTSKSFALTIRQLPFKSKLYKNKIINFF